MAEQADPLTPFLASTPSESSAVPIVRERLFLGFEWAASVRSRRPTGVLRAIEPMVMFVDVSVVTR